MKSVKQDVPQARGELLRVNPPKRNPFSVFFAPAEENSHGYLVEKLPRLVGQRVVREHAVVAIDAVARGVEQLAREIPWVFLRKKAARIN